MTDVSDWGQFDKEDDWEPSEPDFDAIADEEHSREVHGGGACSCPVPTQAEIDATWAEYDRKHSAEVHGGGACTCVAPF